MLLFIPKLADVDTVIYSFFKRIIDTVIPIEYGTFIMHDKSFECDLMRIVSNNRSHIHISCICNQLI